jgi:hypothetical protein
MIMGLHPEMMYRVRTTHPLDPTQGSPLGVTQYWQVTEAELTGDRIDAKLAVTGGDWMQMSSDGFWRPNVRAQFETNDGAIVLMHYTGLVEQTEAFKRAAEADRETQWHDQYLRLAIRFDTGAERYRWLNTNLFVAAGRLLGTGRIEYTVCRLT